MNHSEQARQRLEIAWSSLIASSVCFETSRVVAEHANWLKYTLVGLGTAFVITAIVVGVSGPIHSAVSNAVRWFVGKIVRLLGKHGEALRPPLQVATDATLAGMYLCAPIAAAHAVYRFSTTEDRSTWELVQGIFGFAVITAVFLVLFVYRQFQRTERSRDANFQSALASACVIIDQLGGAAHNNAEAVIQQCSEALDKLRGVLLDNRNRKEDDGLFLSFHEIDNAVDSLAYKTITIPHSIHVSSDSRKRAIESERSIVLAMLAEVSSEKFVRYAPGSACGEEFFANDRSKGGAPRIHVADDSDLCQSLDDSYLMSLPEGDRESFKVRSHMLAELTCADPDAPEVVARECSFPVFACHNRPGQFNERDKALFQLVCDALQRFLRRHATSLIKRSGLLPGDRTLFRSVLHGTGEAAKAEKGGEIAIRRAGSMSRYACTVDRIDKARAGLRNALQYSPKRWDVLSMEDGLRIGSVLAHQAPTGMAVANKQLAAIAVGSAETAAVADLCWAVCSVRYAQENQLTDTVFVRLAPSTIMTDCAGAVLKWMRSELGDQLAISVQMDVDGVTALVRGACSRVREADIELCLENVRSIEDLNMAIPLRPKWIRLPLDLVQAASPEQLGGTVLEGLVYRVSSDPRFDIIIPGLADERVRQAVKGLSRNKRLMAYEQSSPKGQGAYSSVVSEQ